MSIQRRLITLAASSRFTLAIVISTAALGGGLTILQAWLLAKIINDVHLGNAGQGQIFPVLLIMIVVILFRSIFVFVNEKYAAISSEKIKANLREKLAGKILRLGPAYTRLHKGGELTYAVTQAIDALDAYFSQYLPQVMIAAILPVGILTVVFPLDLLSAVILLLTAPLIPIFMILVGRTTESLTHKQYSAFSRMSAFFLDTLRGLAELKNLGRSIDHANRLDLISKRYREATLQVLRISFLSALVLELAATLSVAVIAVEIGIRLIYGQIAFQQAFFLLVIAPEFYLPLRQLGVRFHAAQNGVSAARKIFEILDQSEINYNLPETANLLEISTLFQSPFLIKFENVSFAYPGRDREAVSNISFELKSGESTVLVGLNGSGKSTLAALLLRFIQPDSGRITFNQMDIQNIPITQWRGGIAWLAQQPVLFNASIRENLIFVRENATDAQIQRALDASYLSETIAAMPAGLNTNIGENAFRLSGGQTQRLGIARALLKDAAVLVMDEPTSHLDAVLETELSTALAKLRKDRTSLLIAHRKETARQADQILVMERGRLVEQGTHSDLIYSNYIYAKFFGESAL